MDLVSALTRRAVQRAHVLVIEVPGWSATRMRAERELRRRGWALAASTAEADVLLVCGVPGPALEAVCDRAWDQLPGPRARAAAGAPGSVAAALDDAVVALLDAEAQHRDARERLLNTADDDGASADHAAERHHDGEHGDTSDGDMDHSAMDHGDMGHGDMEMEMPMPGGIGLAEGGPDRDGLDLDVLNVPLGPVLLHWPAGLVLRCALQGDVITDASVEILEAAEAPPSGDGAAPEDIPEPARELCVRRCDSAGRLLALAGAESLSARAFLIRDRLLEGTALDDAAEQLRLLRHGVGRSWLLRWSLKEPSGVWESLTGWLEEAVAAAEGTAAAAGTGPAGGAPTADERGRLESLPERVRGLDLAAARLAVAAFNVNLATSRQTEAHGG